MVYRLPMGNERTNIGLSFFMVTWYALSMLFCTSVWNLQSPYVLYKFSTKGKVASMSDFNLPVSFSTKLVQIESMSELMFGNRKSQVCSASMNEKSNSNSVTIVVHGVFDSHLRDLAFTYRFAVLMLSLVFNVHRCACYRWSVQICTYCSVTCITCADTMCTSVV